MTATEDWPDPEAALVERALKMQAGSILANAVLRLRSQVAALLGEHSGACDDMAQCTRCWERGQIEEAAQLRAAVAAVDAVVGAACVIVQEWNSERMGHGAMRDGPFVELSDALVAYGDAFGEPS